MTHGFTVGVRAWACGVAIATVIAGCSSNGSSDTCGADGDCPTGQKCVSGHCLVPSDTGCPDGQTPCGSTCFDLRSDEKNCGNCGYACAAGLSCIASTCQIECASGETNCSGTCVSTQSDVNNCGSCSNACTAGVSCVLGICIK